MATEIEYALMAGAAYISTRSEINRFPAPQGWIEIPEFRKSDPITGFESVTFQKGTNIVISYAGTNPNDGILPPGPDNTTNIGLATGFGATQLLQAAEYYLQVKAANPTATTITFTGHSLGGGLAALMGVFFGKSAFTFDQAPFANSAESSLITPDVAANLKAGLLARGYSESDLTRLTDYLNLRAVTGSIPNSSLVTDINVQGEFLSGIPWNTPDRIGVQADISNSASGVSGFDLHSQALLTAFLQSWETAASERTFNDVTIKLTDLMGMIFSSSLFVHTTDTTNTIDRNFLERLVQHEAGVRDPLTGTVTTAADAMVTRFTNDLWKLAQNGGLTMTDNIPGGIFSRPPNNVSKALIAFAMQKYYDETPMSEGYNMELFTDLVTAGSGSGGGGVQFDRADVAATLDKAKGYTLYFQNYLNSDAFTNNERPLIQSLLPTLRDWYVQAGDTANDANYSNSFERSAA